MIRFAIFILIEISIFEKFTHQLFKRMDFVLLQNCKAYDGHFKKMASKCSVLILLSFLIIQNVVGQAEIQNPAFPFWKIKGNTNTDTAVNFLGTTDGNYLTFRTNNVRRLTIDLDGNTGLGTIYPQEKLHLSGIGSSARLEGVGTGGSYLNNTTLSADKIVWADANGTLRGLPNGIAGSILAIDNTTNSPLWINGNGLFWKLTGNSGITTPAVPAVYGTSTILTTENWIGTTDANDFVIGTNKIERVRIMKSTGFVGIGTAAPANKLTVQPSVFTTAATASTYALAINNITGVQDITLGSSASFSYLQSWNTKPLLLNSLGNFLGVNLTTAPIQNLDINGRINVTNGVIQRGTTAITATSDLGLYSQVSGNWIRLASNSAPIKFFTDQGGTTGIGTNATMSVDPNGGVIMGSNGAPAANSILEIVSTTKGILFPRMTEAERDAIPAPGCGLHIYNTTQQCLNYWDCNNNIWNSYCCPAVVATVSSSTNCYNLFSATGSYAIPRCVVLKINAGVTIGGCVGGGCGGAAVNCSGFPSGTKITIYNNGTIIGKGGDGGTGGRESDAICQGDFCATAGQCGGDAILGAAGVQITVINTGTISGGGGGGGGGAGGGCSAGGGGGGGAGIPGGAAGGGNSFNCTSGFVCGCGGRTGSSSGGGAGSTFVPGGPGAGAGSSSSGCSCNQNGANGGGGGSLTNNGSAGSGVGGGCLGSCSGAGGAGGVAGAALRGNGGGSTLTGGTVTGVVIP